MKKSFIILLIMLSFAFANDLPAYVAKFDKQLAVELYQKEVEKGADLSENYTALATLYDEIGKVGLAEDCYRHLLDIHHGSDDIYRSYLTFLYRNGQYPKLRHIINEEKLENDWSGLIYAESYFKEGVFDSSFAFAQKLPDELAGKLLDYSVDGLNLKYKSPALGGIMSAVIPGSGKIYGGRLLDGMQAFTVVLAPAYNAYYHFAKNGAGSAQAWIWTAVASWFYLSDIYGSVKAVKEYNDMLTLKVIEGYGE